MSILMRARRVAAIYSERFQRRAGTIKLSSRKSEKVRESQKKGARDPYALGHSTEVVTCVPDSILRRQDEEERSVGQVRYSDSSITSREAAQWKRKAGVETLTLHRVRTGFAFN